MKMYMYSSNQINYLLDEDQTFGEDGKGSHGPNTVISLLDHALGKYGLGEKNAKMHSDNCCGKSTSVIIKFHGMSFMFNVFQTSSVL